MSEGSTKVASVFRAEEIESGEATNSSVAKKLNEALREFVREAMPKGQGGGNGATGDGEDHPTKKDVFFFVLFAANVAVLTWSLPAAVLKNEQLEFLEKFLPAAGGSAFAVIAAWYKKKALEISRSRIFRWSQLPLGVMALLFGAPILPVHVIVQPAEAVLYLENNEPDSLRAWHDTLWLRFARHKLIVTHYDGTHWNTREFQRKRREFVHSVLHGQPMELPLLYSLRIDLQDPGEAISIRRGEGEFDEDFLDPKALQPSHLAEIDRQTLKFTLKPGEISALTNLPAGKYVLTETKAGCRTPGQAVILPQLSDPEHCSTDMPALKCP